MKYVAVFVQPNSFPKAIMACRFEIVLSKVSLVSPEEGSDINRLVRFVSDSLNTRGVLLSKVLKVFVSSLVVVDY